MADQVRALPVRSVAALRAELRGRILVPTDADYSRATRGRGLAPVRDRRPALIVEPEGQADVARALAHALDRGLDVSVRSGGNDVQGASTTSDGLLLDLNRLNRIELDPGSRIVRTGAGVRAGELTAAGAPHGLVPMVGMNPNVGLGGLTLGGGMGWFAGRFGATVDHLLAAEVVTADGEIVRADAESHPDLYWALRGGGGNFGVVTSFTYRMQPVAQVLAGDLGFAAEPAEMLRFLRTFLADGPDELEIGALFTLAPDPVTLVRLCWSGDPAAGEAALRPLRRFAPAIIDSVRLQGYASFANAVSPHDQMVCRGGELDGLDDASIDALVALIDAGGPQGCMVGVLHFIHGALCDPPSDTPFLRTPGHILYNIVAPWQGPELASDQVSWAEAASEAMRAVTAESTYINYLSYAGEQYVRAAYGRHYERLRGIKRRYDPGNVFHNNRNIPA